MTFTESRQNGLNFVLTVIKSLFTYYYGLDWNLTLVWGTIFFLYSFNSVFLKTSYKTEMPLSNKINTTVIHDMISNKNLKCEGKKKLQQILIFADTLCSMGSTWAVNHLLAPPCTSWSVAFSGWSSWTTRLPSVTFPWKTGSPLPFFNFEFITGSCELGSEEGNKNCYFGKLV